MRSVFFVSCSLSVVVAMIISGVLVHVPRLIKDSFQDTKYSPLLWHGEGTIDCFCVVQSVVPIIS